MTLRDVVEIDLEKCDGCGLCVPACEEGAIRIVGGKARVVSETYCDGLGACLGHCPQGAISIVQRQAAPFDEEAVARHLATSSAESSPHGCPGTRPQQLEVLPAQASTPCTGAMRMATSESPGTVSRLANWPVQLHLVSPDAPFLRSADLLLVADCVPFACGDFHARIMDGRPVMIGCPKLDDGRAYVEKLARIITTAQVRSITVVHMEVPCCTGLLRIAEAAVQLASSGLSLHSAVVTIKGEIVMRPPAPCVSSS